jgi:hypothetical protein
MLSGLISKGCQSNTLPVCLVIRLTQMDNITVMQLSNSLQSGLQNLFPGSHRHLILHYAQEIIFQVFIYEYTLLGNFIQRNSYASCLRQSRLNVLIESRENIHGYVFQYEFILARSAIALAKSRDPPRGEVARTKPATRDLDAVFPVSIS